MQSLIIYFFPEPTKNGKHNGERTKDSIDQPEAAPKADWKAFLGADSEEKSSIMIRFPDGRRETKSFPCTSQFKVGGKHLFCYLMHFLQFSLLHPAAQAVALYVSSQGFPAERYEIVTNFPRRILTNQKETATLKELGLFPQEAVFVQEKSQ